MKKLVATKKTMTPSRQWTRCINSSKCSLPVVILADMLGNSLGAFHLFEQLDPSIVGDVIAAYCIVQHFVGGGLTMPCGLQLLAQLLQGLLQALKPWCILPLDELAWLIFVLR